MAKKKIRPSLKDYLRTGVVRFNDEGEQGTGAEQTLSLIHI